jgi:hypothetical protein
MSEPFCWRADASRSVARRRRCRSRRKCCARSCVNCWGQSQSSDADNYCDGCEGSGGWRKANDPGRLVRSLSVNLNLMIPILDPYFHNAHSLRRARFSYLLDSGTKEGQSVFACSPAGLYLSGTCGKLCVAHCLTRRIPQVFRLLSGDLLEQLSSVEGQVGLVCGSRCRASE